MCNHDLKFTHNLSGSVTGKCVKCGEKTFTSAKKIRAFKRLFKGFQKAGIFFTVKNIWYIYQLKRFLK